MFEFVVRASCPLYRSQMGSISREQDAPTTAILEKLACSQSDMLRER